MTLNVSKKLLLVVLLFSSAKVAVAQSLSGVGFATATSPYAIVAPPTPLKGIPYNGTIRTSGSVGNVTCTLISGSVPAGLTLSGCGFTGTATTATTYSPRFTVTDSATPPNSQTQTFNMNVPDLTTINVAPSPTNVAVGSSLQLTGTCIWAFGPSTPCTTSLNWVSGTPANVTVNNTNNKGLVTGVGGASAIITASLGGIMGTDTVNVTGSVPTNPAISTLSLVNGQINQAYTPQQLGCTGGTSPYTFSLFSGALPTGFPALPSTGLISGTSTVPAVYTIGVRCTDSLANVSPTKTLTITIADLSTVTDALVPTSITVGSTSQATATGHYTDTSVANLTSGSTITSQINVGTAVAAVDNTGTTISSLTSPAFNAIAGGAIYAACRSFTDNGATHFTVTDLAGNTFTSIGARLTTQTPPRLAEHFIAKNIKGNATDTATCVPKDAGGATTSEHFFAMAVIPITGLDTSSPLDQHSEVDSGGSPLVNACGSSALTTTSPIELLLHVCTHGSGRVDSVAPSFTMAIQDPSNTMSLEYRTVSATGTYTVSNAFAGAPANAITLTATFKAGTTTGGTAWTSSNTAVATPDSHGVVTGLDVGTANITATNNGHSGSALLTVTASPITSLAILPLNNTCSAGPNQFATFQAIAQPGNQDVTSSAQWASSNSNFASLVSPGRFACNNAGVATITAQK